MASEAQIAANRRNAAKSTGPTSARGKEMAAQNALRHGLRAERLVCFDEKVEDFAAALEALRTALAPADEFEEQLVERVALCAWRLRRASQVEAEMFNAFLDPKPRIHDTKLASVFDCVPFTMTTLSRYEASLDRALKTAHAMLERRQARRRGEPVLAPIEVHVEAAEAAGALIDGARDSKSYQTKPISLGESTSAVLEPGG